MRSVEQPLWYIDETIYECDEMLVSTTTKIANAGPSELQMSVHF